MRHIQKGGLSSTRGEDSTDVKVGWAENILIPSCHVCYRNSPHSPPNKKQKRDKAHLRRGKPHGLGDKSYREAFSRFSAAAEPLQPFCSNWPEQELETVESVVTGEGGRSSTLPCDLQQQNKLVPLHIAPPRRFHDNCSSSITPLSVLLIRFSSQPCVDSPPFTSPTSPTSPFPHGIRCRFNEESTHV